MFYVEDAEEEHFILEKENVLRVVTVKLQR